MIICNVEQLTTEWFAARCGIPTASNFDKIVTTKGDPSKSAKKYMYQLAGEAITGIKEETYQNGQMQRGIELEAEARTFYDLIRDSEVTEVGFCYRDEKKQVGASPDGLVGADGLLEIKCPLLSTHVEYLLSNKLPTVYFQQIQGQLYVTDRKWCDFLSYYPGMQPFIIRVDRDEEYIEKMDKILQTFVSELDEIVEKLREKNG